MTHINRPTCGILDIIVGDDYPLVVSLVLCRPGNNQYRDRMLIYEHYFGY